MKKLRVTVDGKTFEVSVEMLDAPVAAVPVYSAPVITSASVSAPVAAARPVAAAPAAGGAGSVPSPLSGKVVSVDVQVGQAVTEGTQLVTLEAMKMNTFVYAPKAGKVSAISVNAGDGVEEGATLVTLE